MPMDVCSKNQATSQRDPIFLKIHFGIPVRKQETPLAPKMEAFLRPNYFDRRLGIQAFDLHIRIFTRIRNKMSLRD